MLSRGTMQHMQTRSGTGTFFCLASGAAFGAMAIFAKLAYKQGATVATVLSFRFILAAGLFWLLVLAGGHLGELRSLTRRQVRAGLLLGACGYAIQSGCYFTALTHIDASLLSLLLYTFPALGQLHPGAVSLAGWAWLASIAVVSTVAAIGLFFAGLRLAGPTTASILATVEPLVTVLLAFLVFGETLGPVQIAGGVLVLSAVLVLRLRPVRAIRSRAAWAES